MADNIIKNVNIEGTDYVLEATQFDGKPIGNFLLTNNLNYTQTGKNYAVKKDSSNNLYINVPWTDTNKYHTSGSWSGLTYNATAKNGAEALTFTIPTGTGSNQVALGNHNHDSKYALQTHSHNNYAYKDHGHQYLIPAALAVGGASEAGYYEVCHQKIGPDESISLLVSVSANNGLTVGILEVRIASSASGITSAVPSWLVTQGNAINVICKTAYLIVDGFNWSLLIKNNDTTGKKYCSVVQLSNRNNFGKPDDTIEWSFDKEGAFGFWNETKLNGIHLVSPYEIDQTNVVRVESIIKGFISQAQSVSNFLTVQANGTTQFNFNGSTTQTLNLTPSLLGINMSFDGTTLTINYPTT